MNINGILGLLLMWLFLLLCCGFENIGAFINIPSVQLVFAGTLAGTFASFPMKILAQMPSIIVKAFTTDKTDHISTIKLLVEFAEKARKEGILALEGPASKVSDEFLKKGLQLAVDGTEPDLIRDILETDIANIEERHLVVVDVWNYTATLAPSIGMMGTVIGLVLMLGNLTDISSVGPNMAIALITTFYGSIVANCVCTPIANMLGKKNAEESLSKNLMVEGIMSIQAGDNPRIVEQKLAAYISPINRVKVIKVR